MRARRLCPICFAVAAIPGLGVGQYTGAYSPRILRAGPYSAPTRISAWTAEPRQRIALRSEPAARAKSLGRATPRTPARNVARFLVRGSGIDAAGVTWVRLLVAGGTRPIEAWAPVGQLRLAQTPLRVEIRLASRRIEVRRAGHLVARARIAVGGPATPTPTGTFAVREIRRPGQIVGRAIGRYVVALNGLTPSPNEYPYELRRLAIVGVGRNSGRLLARAPTLGSVRTTNRAARSLGRVVSTGVPVVISTS